MQFRISSGGILYGEVVILDTSAIEDQADYGGMLYELKKLEVREGREYQIDNAGCLLMYRDAYKRCKRILENFGVKVVNE
ncbi:MAG: hypothetical protein DDT41_01645 [candidate division WS2 bacterium]|nr:hypothetical protein [Candidatus Psychracetigena formicireducens]